MKKTALLQSLLGQYQSLLAEDEYLSFAREVERLLQHYSDLLSAYPPGAERGRLVQALIDEQEQLSSHIKTTCKKGCGFCCHLEVEITYDDAMVLLESLRAGVSVNLERLASLSQRQRLDDEWKKGAVESNRCVFLGADNACRNYANRPTVCRKHSVVSAVEECARLGGNPVPKLMPMAEIIMSAAINQPGNEFAALPKMLQKVLDEERDRTNTRSLALEG